MRVLRGGRWTDDYLDFCRRPSEYRIAVRHWRAVRRLDDVYFVRPRSARLVIRYWSELGLRAVIRKIKSRLAESGRNDKYVACGAGTIIEAPEDGGMRPGSEVLFIAPCHPECVDRLALPPEFVFRRGTTPLPTVPAGMLRFASATSITEAGELDAVAGWSPDSGIELGADTLRAAHRAASTIVAREWEGVRLLPTKLEPPRERKGGKPNEGTEPSAVLFGYGNYAKTTVLPRMRAHVRLACVHEVDPTQLPRRGVRALSFDTSPSRRADERFDVHLIAGFHHTHAPLACDALAAGAYAVVEKPVATTARQLEALRRALQVAPHSLFVCFHKRYLPFNDAALADLRVEHGEAVSYHCLVFEEPLPALHWYRWPTSRSRLTSNGCHWIDHFLFLNAYASPSDISVETLGDGSLNCSMSLVNGAAFTMVLTDRGSSRLGVQDHVELRANGVTATIRNGTHYHAEDGSRVLRRARLPRLRSYDEMYRSIGTRIRAGADGDSLASVEVSTRAVLAFEEELEAVMRRGPSLRRP